MKNCWKSTTKKYKPQKNIYVYCVYKIRQQKKNNNIHYNKNNDEKNYQKNGNIYNIYDKNNTFTGIKISNRSSPHKYTYRVF